MKYKTMNFFDDEKALQFYVSMCDRRLDEEMEASVGCIESTKDIKIFGLTGPTCAGKTTAAAKITKQLESKGFSVHTVSIDDFYYDKEYLQKRADNDPNIEIDYDSEETIDIELLAEQTDNLLSCKKTYLPRFDFRSGKRISCESVIPQKKDIFLFEGIQILYPKVHAILNHAPTYKSIYICPTSGIEAGEHCFAPNEIRLLRRLVRDFLHRDTTPEFTFYLWKSVRENEEKNIFPYTYSCNETIDSTLPYEIGMLKPFLTSILKTISNESLYYEQANEILKKIENIPIVSQSYMTENSLYKEFI